MLTFLAQRVRSLHRNQHQHWGKRNTIITLYKNKVTSYLSSNSATNDANWGADLNFIKVNSILFVVQKKKHIYLCRPVLSAITSDMPARIISLRKSNRDCKPIWVWINTLSLSLSFVLLQHRHTRQSIDSQLSTHAPTIVDVLKQNRIPIPKAMRIWNLLWFECSQSQTHRSKRRIENSFQTRALISYSKIVAINWQYK